MTKLRCACGVVVEGTGEQLLHAVERHLADAHRVAPSAASQPTEDDDRTEPHPPPRALADRMERMAHLNDDA